MRQVSSAAQLEVARKLEETPFNIRRVARLVQTSPRNVVNLPGECFNKQCTQYLRMTPVPIQHAVRCGDRSAID